MTIDDNSRTISTLLRTIGLKEQKLLNEKLRQKASVTTQQAMILRIIATKPGLIQKDIVNIVNRQPATISVLLKKMETDKLIIRKIPTNNSRNKELYLTKKGQAVVESFRGMLNAVSEEMSKNLTNDQKEELIGLLNIIAQGID